MKCLLIILTLIGLHIIYTLLPYWLGNLKTFIADCKEESKKQQRIKKYCSTPLKLKCK